LAKIHMDYGILGGIENNKHPLRVYPNIFNHFFINFVGFKL